jgi:hypothetical protein
MLGKLSSKYTTNLVGGFYIICTRWQSAFLNRRRYWPPGCQNTLCSFTGSEATSGLSQAAKQSWHSKVQCCTVHISEVMDRAYEHHVHQHCAQETCLESPSTWCMSVCLYLVCSDDDIDPKLTSSERTTLPSQQTIFLTNYENPWKPRWN